MKILFLISSMGGGGAERVAALLANSWTRRGDDVTLMTTFSERGECVYRLDEGVQLEFLSDHCEANTGRVQRLRTMRRFIRRSRPDVIVSFLTNVNVAALLAGMGLGIPVIASERTYPPLETPSLPLFYRVMRRLTYPTATALVAQTVQTADWMRQLAPKVRIATIPNPIIVPLPVSEPSVEPADVAGPDDRIILWAGRLDGPKRPEIIVEAFARLAPEMPDWKLALTGSGPRFDEMKQLVAALRLEDRILLPGFVGNLGSWYERADIYVMTTSFEGFPNSMLEALAHGRASIAFDVLTGLRELSDSGRRLRLLPDQDHVNALTEALRGLMSSRVSRDRLTAAARDVTEVYSERAICAMWDDLFAACLGSRPSAEPEFRTGRAE
ncbi:MAG: glycosyltransferase family 4 protein [Alphaproteobacteria bacterium HGW-Alphaproteobacteria-17]|nr:MAG: glycosyltransferase family 4 protein [Alphaproteobacteria bacterium HGW-Alphaproteobacteria-17]